VPVQQVREVGPPVERAVRIAPERRAGRLVEPVQVAGAAGGPPGVVALRGPAGGEPEVGGEAPAPVGLEHVVVEDVVASVGPVVGQLAPVVVAHDVRVAERGAARPGRRPSAAADHAGVGDADEAIHLAAVHRLSSGLGAVRAAAIAKTRIVEGAHAVADPVRHADGRRAVAHRDAVGAGVGAEVGVEGAVLLHDHDHVPDLVDAVEPVDLGRRKARDAVAGGRCAADQEHAEQKSESDRSTRRVAIVEADRSKRRSRQGLSSAV
jgi:hypothetical protein